MRGGNKSLNLYRELSGMIKSGQLPPGHKLPPENEMAVQYEVSIGTIRKALQMLLDENMIVRTKKKGSFITERKNPVPVTILLPCPDYLTHATFSTYSLLEIIHGAISAAAEHGVRIETVVVGSNGTPEDIYWRNLDFITNESRVIVYGIWYSKIFPFLMERRCRVAFCHSMVRPDILRTLEESNWDMFLIDGFAAAQQGVEHLLAQGCRRIACCSTRLQEPGHPFVQGYRETLRKYGLSADPELEVDNPEKLKEIQADGILMDNPTYPAHFFNNFYNHLKISPKTKIVFRHDYMVSEVSPPVSATRFDFCAIGKDMVNALLAGEPGKEHHYIPELVRRGPDSLKEKSQRYFPYKNEIVLNI